MKSENLDGCKKEENKETGRRTSIFIVIKNSI
jgi:hypothetical protein